MSGALRICAARDCNESILDRAPQARFHSDQCAARTRKRRQREKNGIPMRAELWDPTARRSIPVRPCGSELPDRDTWHIEWFDEGRKDRDPTELWLAGDHERAKRIAERNEDRERRLIEAGESSAGRNWSSSGPDNRHKRSERSDELRELRCPTSHGVSVPKATERERYVPWQVNQERQDQLVEAAA